MRQNRFGLLIMGAAYALSACADGGIPTEPSVKQTRFTIPGAPVIAEVVAGSGRLVVAYSAPTDDGGSQITGYAYSVDGGTSWTTAQTPASGGAITLDSLENGKTYSIALRAINAAGPGQTASALGTPSTVPSQIRITGIAAGNQTLSVAFAIPDSGGSRILHYDYSVDGGSRWFVADSTNLVSPILITALTNGTSYSVRLRAVNAAGVGPVSESFSATPITIPAAPVVTGVSAALDKLIMRVSEGENGGSPVTGYEYSLDSGQRWIPAVLGEGGVLEIGGLNWQVQYSVRVRAGNKAGFGPFTVATGTPLSLPASPTALVATAGDGEIVVAFTAPAHFGGAILTGYEYSLDSGATWVASTAALSSTQIRVAGLDNGKIYKVSVRARTASGIGSAAEVVTAMPFVASPHIDSVRVISRGGRSFYIPQMLDERDPAFDLDLARALQRYRTLHGRDAKTLFEKVQAAADYVSNMAKHPYTHNLGTEYSDPRAWEYLDFPVKLAALSRENQRWNGIEWSPAEGKTLNDVPAIECTFQDFILGGLVNALGAQWMLLGITSHDAFTYYDNELGKWVYIDATYNEHYRSGQSSSVSYVPLSPWELREMSLAGDNSMISVQGSYQSRRTEAEYKLAPYVEMHPLGFNSMMADVNGISSGERLQRGEHLRVVPGGLSEAAYGTFIAGGWTLAAPDEDLWAAQGETFVESLVSSARGNRVSLSTNLAAASVVFERQVDRGAWTVVPAESELNGLVGEIRFRARGAGFSAGEVILRQSAK